MHFTGKLMENVLHYKNLKLISSPEQHEKYTTKPQLKYFHIISPELVCVEMMKTNVVLNKPLCSG